MTLLCIYTGIAPYKRLCQLEKSPFKLEVIDDRVTLFKKNDPLMSIRLKEIEKAEYINTSLFYGVGMKINTNPSIKYNPVSKHRYLMKDYDIVLPYFSEKQLGQLKSRLQFHLQDVMHSDETNKLTTFDNR